MKAVLFGSILMLTACASQANVEDKMFDDSILMHCDQTECVDVKTGEYVKDTDDPNQIGAFMVAFPEGRYSAQEIRDHGPAVSRRYQELVNFIKDDL